MAIIRVLDKPFTGEGQNAPRLTRIDQIESSGSLLLLDMSKLDKLPAIGGYYPNLFEGQASKMTGQITTIQRRNYSNLEGVSKVERTTKGGLHYIHKPNSPLTGDRYTYENIQLQGGIKQYVLENQAEKPFYISQWVRYTRVGNKGSYPANMTADGNHNLNRFFFMQANPSSVQEAKEKLSVTNGLYDPNNLPTINTPFNIFNGGRVGLNVAGINTTDPRDLESLIFYRFYMEDLAVSGRTFEEVRAIDERLFAEAFSPGGKFYGDTFSNPNTAFA